jgi:hypothetical protein
MIAHRTSLKAGWLTEQKAPAEHRKRLPWTTIGGEPRFLSLPPAQRLPGVVRR